MQPRDPGQGQGAQRQGAPTGPASRARLCSKVRDGGRGRCQCWRDPPRPKERDADGARRGGAGGRRVVRPCDPVAGPAVPALRALCVSRNFAVDVAPAPRGRAPELRKLSGVPLQPGTRGEQAVPGARPRTGRWWGSGGGDVGESWRQGHSAAWPGWWPRPAAQGSGPASPAALTGSRKGLGGRTSGCGSAAGTAGTAGRMGMPAPLQPGGGVLRGHVPPGGALSGLPPGGG